MRLFKYKDLTQQATHEHFLQIVRDRCFWCAGPASLNDDEEFRFRLDYQPSPRTHRLLREALAHFGAANRFPPELSATRAITNQRLEQLAAPVVAAMIENCRSTIGVSSFSTDSEHPHLWNTYGGRGNGACVEIEIPDPEIGVAYHPVEYVLEKVFHVDLFLEGALYSQHLPTLFRAMLATKTREPWLQEREIRFIGNSQNVKVAFDGDVRSVTFGRNVPAETLQDLQSRIERHSNGKRIAIYKQA